MAAISTKIQNVREATGRLLLTVRSLDESDTVRPSLCEGWTRGHVLAHIALNADSLVNLPTWARTSCPNSDPGVETTDERAEEQPRLG